MRCNLMIRLCFEPRLYSVAFFLIFLCSNVAATADQGQVSGRVLDPRGAAVAGANLRLANAAGAVIRETTSDEHGDFILDTVDPGEYQLTGEAASFVPVISDVSVAGGQQKQVT